MPEIIIRKQARTLELGDTDGAQRVFPIALGREPLLPKERAGDHRTPEGEYYVCVRNAQSRFYLSLGLSYPNAADAASGRAAGRIDQADFECIQTALNAGRRPPWDTALGREIMIHGDGVACDWTAGCIAVENPTIDLLWLCCPLGTRVVVLT